MEKNLTIYTYGHENITATGLLALMQPYHVNCVVDCRPFQSEAIANNTPSDELKAVLKTHNIHYIPFYQHFGLFPQQTQNKKGNIVYTKAIKTENFLTGVERIQQGMEKGYTICIIDNLHDTKTSKRFTLIGKYLKNTYRIIHLNPSEAPLSQEALEHFVTDYATRRKAKKSQAGEVGKTGEELAALYLARQGYQILDRNWNLHRGCELDIVAQKESTLHFIEVKTRTSDRYGAPQTAINWIKMKHLLKAIHEYRYQRALFHTDYQIDSIAIIYHSDNDYQLKHFLGIRPDGSACDDVHTYIPQP